MAIKVLSTAVNFAKNYTDDVARLKPSKHIKEEISLCKRVLPTNDARKAVKTLLEDLQQKQDTYKNITIRRSQ